MYMYISSCKQQDFIVVENGKLQRMTTFISLIYSAAIDSQNAQLHVNKKMVLKQRIRFLVSV